MTRWAYGLWAWVADPNNLTAISTAIIAAFTIVLATVTTRQVRLARAEFLSTHRPKIIIHSIEIAYDAAPDGKDATIGASVVYFNVGATRARITAINAKISRRPLPLQSGLGVGIGVQLARLSVPTEMIESGHPNIVAVHSEHTLEGERFAERVAQDRGRGGGLICIGQIVYEDERGISRPTGFCRKLDVTSERWVRMDNPEYEYAY